jgi:hypothetical protein
MTESRLDNASNEESRARLNGFFQQRFEQREALRKTQLTNDRVTSREFRQLENEDPNIANLGKSLRQEMMDGTKMPLPAPRERTVTPRDLGPNTIVHIAPYDYEHTWRTHAGAEFFDEPKANRALGDMSFGGWVSGGNDGDFASCACAVGLRFQPTSAVEILQVAASPRITYEYYSYRAHTHAFIGIHVDEYTLAGDFVATVTDQQISLWDEFRTLDTFSGEYPEFTLPTVNLPVSNSNYYEVWVWAGGDISSASDPNGFSNSIATAYLTAHLPSISVNAYTR